VNTVLVAHTGGPHRWPTPVAGALSPLRCNPLQKVGRTGHRPPATCHLPLPPRLDTLIALCYPPVVRIEGRRGGIPPPSPLKGRFRRVRFTRRQRSERLTRYSVQQRTGVDAPVFCCPGPQSPATERHASGSRDASRPVVGGRSPPWQGVAGVSEGPTPARGGKERSRPQRIKSRLPNAIQILVAIIAHMF